MTVEEYHDAVQCKVRGSWNLHHTALEFGVELDFFTLLSSISGVIGQKGQTNYAGANAFLDAFATFRQQQGLKACSVDLGVIEDVGYMSEREGLVRRLDSQAWTGINERLLHKILRFSILQQTSQPPSSSSTTQMITGISIPQKPDSFLMQDIRFSGLSGAYGQTAAQEGSDSSVRSEVRALFALIKSEAPQATLVGAATQLLDRQLQKLLGLSDPIEPGKPLSAYGIDSLAAVEFRNWAKMEVGVEVTTLEIVGSKTLLTLSDSIVTKLTGPK
jgi:hypothetical protein